MKAAAKSDGAEGVLRFIERFDFLESRLLFRFARRGLMLRDWEEKKLDDYAAVIEAFMAAAQQADDPEKKEAVRAGLEPLRLMHGRHEPATRHLPNAQHRPVPASIIWNGPL